MSSHFAAVPWGNLWRWVVSTFFFFLVLGLPIAVLTALNEGSMAPLFKSGVIVVSAIIAAIVVWSDAIPWPGDY